MTEGSEPGEGVTPDLLIAGVSDRLRPFVRIVITGGTASVATPVASAFWLAMHAIGPALAEPRTIDVVFGWDPDKFVVPTTTGAAIAYAPAATTINAYLGNGEGPPPVGDGHVALGQVQLGRIHRRLRPFDRPVPRRSLEKSARREGGR